MPLQILNSPKTQIHQLLRFNRSDSADTCEQTESGTRIVLSYLKPDSTYQNQCTNLPIYDTEP